MLASEFAPTFPSYADESQEDLTFAGALRKFFFNSEIDLEKSMHWNHETQDRYKGYYENLLLPLLPRFKALKDYEDDDFQSAISSLAERYSETSRHRFRYLLWIVYKAGVDAWEYDDHLLWGERGETDDVFTVDDTARLEMIPKSLSIDAEKVIVDWIKSRWQNGIVNIPGQSIGFILMFFLGLRNNEVCGVNFGDIKLQENSGEKFPCLYITKSTVVGSNDLKMSGKTRNAARILPLFDFLYDFLMDRKTAVQDLITEGKFNLSEELKDIDELPVVCRERDYSSRCSAPDITKVANEIFKELGITDKYQTAGLLDTIFKQKLKEIDVTELTPTCYLLRRNTATHLYSLGLSPGQIQYLIGHDIEDTEDKRNFHSNIDDLKEVYDIMKKHPYQVFFGKRLEDIVYTRNSSQEVYLKVVAEEPGDSIRIRLTEGTAMTIHESVVVFPNGYGKTVDVRNVVEKKYDEKNRL